MLNIHLLDLVYYFLAIQAWGLLESLWNCSIFRPGWSWFPFWYKTDPSWVKMGIEYEDEGISKITDPFHLIKGAFSLIGLTALLEWKFISFIDIAWTFLPWPVALVLSAVYISLLWLIYYGLTFPWYFHEFWMRPKMRDLHKVSKFWKTIYFWRD